MKRIEVRKKTKDQDAFYKVSYRAAQVDKHTGHPVEEATPFYTDGIVYYMVETDVRELSVVDPDDLQDILLFLYQGGN